MMCNSRNFLSYHSFVKMHLIEDPENRLFQHNNFWTKLQISICNEYKNYAVNAKNHVLFFEKSKRPRGISGAGGFNKFTCLVEFSLNENSNISESLLSEEDFCYP